MQNSTRLSFGDFLVANPNSQSDELLAWRAKRRKLDEDVSKKAHQATAHAEKESESAQGAAGRDISHHPAADAHAKAYDLHKSAGRLHALHHRKTGDAESGKKAKEHREWAAYHKEHLVALGAIKESAETVSEGSDYDVAVHHFHPDKKKETFNYHVKNAQDEHHANYIALEKHREKKIPAWSYHSSSADAKKVNEDIVTEDSHILKLDIKQGPVTKPVKKAEKIDNVAKMQQSCPLCSKLGKSHSILNHLREQVFTEEILDEASAKHPRHTISVGYDMPNHENRFERFTSRHKDVKVRAASKEEAFDKAHKHIEKMGGRVNHSHHIGEEPIKESVELGEAKATWTGLQNHSSLKVGDKITAWNDHGPNHPLGSKWHYTIAKKDDKHDHMIVAHPHFRPGTVGHSENLVRKSDPHSIHVGQITHVNDQPVKS